MLYTTELGELKHSQEDPIVMKSEFLAIILANNWSNIKIPIAVWLHLVMNRN